MRCRHKPWRPTCCAVGHCKLTVYGTLSHQSSVCRPAAHMSVSGGKLLVPGDSSSGITSNVLVLLKVGRPCLHTACLPAIFPPDWRCLWCVHVYGQFVPLQGLFSFFLALHVQHRSVDYRFPLAPALLLSDLGLRLWMLPAYVSDSESDSKPQIRHRPQPKAQLGQHMSSLHTFAAVGGPARSSLTESYSSCRYSR